MSATGTPKNIPDHFMMKRTYAWGWIPAKPARDFKPGDQAVFNLDGECEVESVKVGRASVFFRLVQKATRARLLKVRRLGSLVGTGL